MGSTRGQDIVELPSYMVVHSDLARFCISSCDLPPMCLITVAISSVYDYSPNHPYSKQQSTCDKMGAALRYPQAGPASLTVCAVHLLSHHRGLCS